MNQLLNWSYKNIYFLGIGGISMSGLAEILFSKGKTVSGSDRKESDNVRHLRQMGIDVKIGHQAENITDDIELLVYTAAVKQDNPEILEAKKRKIPIIDRAELLGHVMAEYDSSIAVSGTHGKTTTTSMISEILLYAHADPTISVGGILPSINGNTRVGRSPFFVAEACEYFDSFLKFNPFLAVILNVEADHLDYFKDLDHIIHSFHQFARRVPKEGCLVINSEIPFLDRILDGLECQVISFGLEKDSAWSAVNIVHRPDGTNCFDAVFHGEKKGQISLQVPGEHNIKNALAACAAADALGISMEKIVGGLKEYRGTNRRFQKKGEFQGVTVVDDYAHHPSEVKATLRAAKNVAHREIWCIFQPHTFSRTKFLLEEFSTAFQDADHIIVADIYAAREKDTGEMSAEIFAEKIRQRGGDAVYAGNFEQISVYLQKHCKRGDLLITMGAGDVYLIGESLIQA